MKKAKESIKHKKESFRPRKHEGTDRQAADKVEKYKAPMHPNENNYMMGGSCL